MSRRLATHLLVITVVLAAMVLTGLLARSQSTQLAYLPIVATSRPTVIVLIDADTTMVSAYVLPGTQRIIVTYIDRANGNRAHITEDIGTRVVEIPVPPEFATLQSSNQPAFVVPGDKQANSVVVATNGILHIYVTSRDEGDPTGPFKLKRLDMPLP
jgi:hypothetical protein